MDTRKKDWEEAYLRKENVVFYPHEEIIRFIAYHIKKRTGLNEYLIKKDFKTALDFGCGIGRHVKFLDEMGFSAYGFDLSETAIEMANSWFKSIGKDYLCDRLVVTSSTQTPYEDSFFDIIVSHGVFDSMHYDIAEGSIKEAARIIKTGGMFYLDLWASDEGKEFVATEGIATNTVRNYYNIEKINKLIGGKFDIIDNRLITINSIVTGIVDKRYHLILTKR